MGEAGAEALDFSEVHFASQQAQSDDGERGGQRIAFALGAVRVGHLAQGVLEAGALGGVQGTTGGVADGQGWGVLGGECGGAEFFLRVRRQRFEPKPLGAVVAGEEVAAVAREANGFSHGNPAGGFVTGAGMGLGVGEGFGQQRRVAVVRAPLVGQRAVAAARTWEARLGRRAASGMRKRA